MGTAAGWQETRTPATLTRSTTPTAEASQSVDSAHEQIDWRKQWWPVHPLHSLPTDRPFGITIMGQDLVVWRDLEERFRVFADLCPHRKVALSEGRIESDGTLQCSYHGWRFNSEGQCTTIPQIDDPAKEERICASSAACATAYPTVEANGLLWVQLTPGPSPASESEVPVPGLAGYSAPALAASWYSREMAMSWEVLVENITDMSHVPFAHHGLLGSRERPMTPAWMMEDHGVSGYTLTEDSFKSRGAGNLKFKMQLDMSSFPTAYSLNTLQLENPEDSENEWRPRPDPSFRLLFHAVPVTRTTSRIIYRHEAYSKQSKALNKIPAWIDHMRRSEVLDGDMVFLNRLALSLESGTTSPQKDYFTPAETDKAVRVFWNFLGKHAVNGIDYFSHNPDLKLQPREAALNRYEQHTKNCSICRSALRNIRLGMHAALVAAVALVCTTIVLLGRGFALLGPPAVVLALSAVALAGREALKKLERKFLFTDYVHAEQN